MLLCNNWYCLMNKPKSFPEKNMIDNTALYMHRLFKLEIPKSMLLPTMQICLFSRHAGKR